MYKTSNSERWGRRSSKLSVRKCRLCAANMHVTLCLLCVVILSTRLHVGYETYRTLYLTVFVGPQSFLFHLFLHSTRDTVFSTSCDRWARSSAEPSGPLRKVKYVTKTARFPLHVVRVTRLERCSGFRSSALLLVEVVEDAPPRPQEVVVPVPRVQRDYDGRGARLTRIH